MGQRQQQQLSLARLPVSARRTEAAAGREYSIAETASEAIRRKRRKNQEDLSVVARLACALILEYCRLPGYPPEMRDGCSLTQTAVVRRPSGRKELLSSDDLKHLTDLNQHEAGQLANLRGQHTNLTMVSTQ